jgi:hypothetical protein
LLRQTARLLLCTFCACVLALSATAQELPVDYQLKLAHGGPNPQLVHLTLNSALGERAGVRSVVNYGLTRSQQQPAFAGTREVLGTRFAHGTELFSHFSLDGIRLEPSLRWNVQDQNGQRRSSNALALRVDHNAFSLRWRDLREVTEQAARREQHLQELTGLFKLSEQIRLEPAFSLREHSTGGSPARLEQSSSLLLGISPQLSQAPELKLKLHWLESDSVDSARRALTADFGVRKQLMIAGMPSSRTSLGAAITYRHQEDELVGFEEDSIGFKLTLERQFGRP